MKKSIPSNSKISHTILCMIFSILFIFTALKFSSPLTAYAEGEQLSWLGEVDAEGMNYVYIPGKIYWGGSDTRTGLLFYCVDTESGKVIPKTIKILYNKEVDDNGDRWMDKINDKFCYTRVGDVSTYHIEPKLNTSIPNTGAWENTDGSPIKAWLESDSGSTLPTNGEPLPMHAALVKRYCGDEVLDKVIHQEYTVCFEGMYGLAVYSRKDGLDVARCYNESYTQYKNPGVTDKEELAELSIIKYFTTLRCLSQTYAGAEIDITQRDGSNGTANYKWLQSSAKYFRTEEEHFGIPAASSAGTEVTASEIRTTGWNFAVLTMSLIPIHTFDESQGTPGNTEIPDTQKGTDGDCTIKKLYYTQKIASDGTIIEEATDYHAYTRTGTTAYISIDAEEGYEIEGWKASSSNRSLKQKSDYAAVSPVLHSGDSAEEILLDKDTGEKFLYILYKKTEIEENPQQDYDFRLEQSQITKRVTFLEGTGPANTKGLINHNFKWKASAPTTTSCKAHGVFCYDTPCTSWKWTDNATTVNTITDSNK